MTPFEYNVIGMMLLFRGRGGVGRGDEQMVQCQNIVKHLLNGFSGGQQNILSKFVCIASKSDIVVQQLNARSYTTGQIHRCEKDLYMYGYFVFSSGWCSSMLPGWTPFNLISTLR